MMLLGLAVQSVASGELDPGPVPYTFVEIDHEIISTVIITLLLQLIQEGLLLVTIESMCTKNWLTA